MTDTHEFIDEFFEHAKYDPVKAREYYLRTRKLKGRKPGSSGDRIAPGAKVGYNGKPLKPIGQRIEEDETPNTSPSGAKLVDYDGKGLGKATYSDGSVYDPAVGWKKGGTGEVARAKATNASQRAKSEVARRTSAAPAQRVSAAQQKLVRAKTLSRKVKDPKARAALLKRLSSTEQRLRIAQAKHSPTPRRGVPK